MLGAVAIAPFANSLVEPHQVIIGTSAFLAAAGVLALVGMRPSRGREPAAEPESEAAATRVLRAGDDLTIVTSAALAETAGAAARALDGEFSVEVVAAPTLADWDRAIVLASVEKTSKVLVVHDNSGNETLAAEIVATIVEECSEHLDAPVRRAAIPDQALSARVRDLAEY